MVLVIITMALLWLGGQHASSLLCGATMHGCHGYAHVFKHSLKQHVLPFSPRVASTYSPPARRGSVNVNKECQKSFAEIICLIYFAEMLETMSESCVRAGINRSEVMCSLFFPGCSCCVGGERSDRKGALEMLFSLTIQLGAPQI